MRIALFVEPVTDQRALVVEVTTRTAAVGITATGPLALGAGPDQGGPAPTGSSPMSPTPSPCWAPPGR
jgi:hypothetical protein